MNYSKCTSSTRFFEKTNDLIVTNRKADNPENCLIKKTVQTLVIKAFILNGLLEEPFQTSNSLYAILKANKLERKR